MLKPGRWGWLGSLLTMLPSTEDHGEDARASTVLFTHDVGAYTASVVTPAATAEGPLREQSPSAWNKCFLGLSVSCTKSTEGGCKVS